MPASLMIDTAASEAPGADYENMLHDVTRT
jgi:hypothetical protein